MRPISASEKPLLEFLARASGISIDIDSVLVEPMNDGGMGSLAIAPGDKKRKFGASVAGCEFNDTDGVLVSAELYLDQDGLPLELDVWKVDSSPLEAYPTSEQIRPAV